MAKNRESFANTLRTDLKKELYEISNQTGININRLLDNAIELLIVDMKNKGLYK